MEQITSSTRNYIHCRGWNDWLIIELNSKYGTVTIPLSVLPPNKSHFISGNYQAKYYLSKINAEQLSHDKQLELILKLEATYEDLIATHKLIQPRLITQIVVRVTGITDLPKASAVVFKSPKHTLRTALHNGTSNPFVMAFRSKKDVLCVGCYHVHSTETIDYGTAEVALSSITNLQETNITLT